MTQFKGRGFLQITGRQQPLQAVPGGWALSKPKEPFLYAGKAEVDGELWYTVKCNKEAGAWVRSLPKEGNWFEHIDSQWYIYQHMFDVHERVYLQLGLKFA